MEGEEEKPLDCLPLPDTLLLKIFNKLEIKDKMNFGLVSNQFRNIWRFTECWNDEMRWDNCDQMIEIILGGAHYARFCECFDTFATRQTGFHEIYRKFPRSATHFELAQTMFMEKLVKNQRRVKSLIINATCPINLRRIEHFPQLRELYFDGESNLLIIHEILLKTGDLLESLTIENTDIDEHKYYPEIQKIYQVSEYLEIDFTLTASQLMNLSAKNIKMPIGTLEAEDIYRFIQSWMNGSRILKRCVWNLEDSPFQIVKSRKFFRCFEVEMESLDYHQLDIRGNAKITYHKDDFLIFEVIGIAENRAG